MNGNGRGRNERSASASAERAEEIARATLERLSGVELDGLVLYDVDAEARGGVTPNSSTPSWARRSRSCTPCLLAPRTRPGCHSQRWTDPQTVRLAQLERSAPASGERCFWDRRSG